MSKVFNKSNQPKVEVSRNTFDLSFQNNVTMELGKIYPVMCKEVLPGDTWRINTAFGLRFMPLAFPIQTRMRADLHFFYVRNRNLFKYWQNFITKTGSVPQSFPVLSPRNKRKHSYTSSLGDYLGLPTTIAANTSVPNNYPNDTLVTSKGGTGDQDIEDSIRNGLVTPYMWACPVTESPSISGEYYYNAQVDRNISSRTLENFYYSPSSAATLNSCNLWTNNRLIKSKLEASGGTFDPISLPWSVMANRSDYSQEMEFSVKNNFHMPCLPTNAATPAYGLPEAMTFRLLPFPIKEEKLYAGRTYEVVIGMCEPDDLDNVEAYALAQICSQEFPATEFTSPSQAYKIPSSSKVCNVSAARLQMNKSTYVFKFTPSEDIDTRGLSIMLAYFNSDSGELLTSSSFMNPVSIAQDMSDDLVSGYSRAYYPMHITQYKRWTSANAERVNPDLYLTAENPLFNIVDNNPAVASPSCTSFAAVMGCSQAYSQNNELTSMLQANSKYFTDAPVSALPFRAYEAIYNSYYRDQRNNPYINPNTGEFDPNDYIPTHDGGVDDNEYDFHYRNWEQDFLTSAQLTPQQGNVTPLVGISSTGVASFVNDDGTIVTARANTSDGDKVTTFDFDSNQEVDSSVRQYAMKVASEGISINDFRAVNSYQRWLETNLRRGYKYKDQLMSHFGVDASFKLLDMPEYIGGSSRSVQIDQINQTSSGSDSDPLGSYAAQASCVGGNGQDVEQYCDEHGFIIACLSIVPVPSYSQLLPKYFLKTEALDYFYPEFGHLGYQPIRYNEVCPAQAVLNGVNLNETYGYQRAWYDYLSSTDEIHGQFRTTLTPFVLTRVFQSLPSVSPEFLLCKQDQLNEVFTITEVDGVPVEPCLGQLHFGISVKRKIPRYGIPRIE